MSEFNQGDCIGSGHFIGKSGLVKFIGRGKAIGSLSIIRGLDKVTYRTNQPWKSNTNVADVLPSAAHTANRAIERMISQ